MRKFYLTVLGLALGITIQAQIFDRSVQVGLQIESDTVLHPFGGRMHLHAGRPEPGHGHECHRPTQPRHNMGYGGLHPADKTVQSHN